MNIYKSKIFTSGWNVAYRRKTGILEDLETPFEVLKNTYRSWAADPFLFENNGETYIFAELYDYSIGRGSIGYHRIGDKNGQWISVISEPYHMSYPQIFIKNGEIYMMPEANASGMLYCYRAVHFPDQWEKLEPIRTDVRYVDTTLFDWAGKELALAYQVDKEPYQLKLLDLQIPENDHSISVSRINQRRPAGSMDTKRRIRPAQDCDEDYGKALVFYEYSIDENMNYHETEIARITPKQLSLSKHLYLDGIHTYNTSDHYEVIDIKTRIFNLISLLSRVKWKVENLRR